MPKPRLVQRKIRDKRRKPANPDRVNQKAPWNDSRYHYLELHTRTPLNAPSAKELRAIARMDPGARPSMVTVHGTSFRFIILKNDRTRQTTIRLTTPSSEWVVFLNQGVMFRVAPDLK